MRHLLIALVMLTAPAASAQGSVTIGNVVIGYDHVGIGVCSTHVTVSGNTHGAVYVGMTARKPDGTEFDFPAHEVVLSGSTIVNFNAIIGLGYTEYVISVWSRKVQPCDSPRPGCRKHGYVLDGQLATTSWRRIP